MNLISRASMAQGVLNNASESRPIVRASNDNRKVGSFARFKLASFCLVARKVKIKISNKEENFFELI